MSFDPFETRLHFLQLLRKLNASQLSIQKVVGYAVKYGSRCGEDLWECITEECAKVGGSSVSTSSSVRVPLREVSSAGATRATFGIPEPTRRSEIQTNTTVVMRR